jgi:tetratricopeptide (TPR) repeat protein
MPRSHPWLAAAFLLASAPLVFAGASPRLQDLLRRGDEAYQRADSGRQIWQAIGYYREALKLDAESFEAHWRLARAFVWQAEYSRTKEEKRTYGQLGYAHATQALKKKPERVEGHFWGALSIGQYGTGIGVFAALRGGVRGTFLKHLNASLRIDRGYDRGGPDRIFAMYYHSLPWPMKSNKKALEHFQQSLRYAPTCAYTHYYLATILVDEKRQDEAKSSLHRCLELSARPENREGTGRCRRLCSGLLAQLGGGNR